MIQQKKILLFISTILIIATTWGCGQRQVTVFEDLEVPPASQGDPQYIVVFNEKSAALAISNNQETIPQGKELIHSMATDLSQALGHKAQKVFTNSIPGGVFTMSQAQVELLRQHPMISYIEKDGVVSISETQTDAPWNLDRIDQSELPLDEVFEIPSGDTIVHAYVIDTGIRGSHEEFASRNREGFDFVDNDGDPTDCNGHGTHVAGTLAGQQFGVAKEVLVHGIRVLDCRGSGRLSDVIAGIDWVTENHESPAVANMSLGGLPSQALDDAVEASVAAGITYVVAAGNSSRSACSESPARVGPTISVGSSNRSDQRSSFSNIGTCVDIFAPGSDITSAWSSRDDDYETISGTSMASPLVAGVAALYLSQNPEALPAQVHEALIANATTGTLSDLGSGSPDRLLSSEFLVAEDSDGGGTDIPAPPGSIALEEGSLIQNLQGNRGDESRYYLDIPAETDRVIIRISGGPGDADLYVKMGDAPTLNSYDCRPYRATANETCTLSVAPGERLHVMLRAYRAYSGVELQVNF